MEEYIYLDNAATTFPKPEAVYQALDRANRNAAVNAGRGSYALAEQAKQFVAAQNFCHNFSLFLTQIFGKYFRNLIHETEGFLPSVFLTFKMIITLLFNVGYNDLFFDFYLFLRKGCNLFLKLIDSVTYLLTLFA